MWFIHNEHQIICLKKYEIKNLTLKKLNYIHTQTEDEGNIRTLNQPSWALGEFFKLNLKHLMDGILINKFEDQE